MAPPSPENLRNVGKHRRPSLPHKTGIRPKPHKLTQTGIDTKQIPKTSYFWLKMKVGEAVAQRIC